ncbi:hypothetical protein QJS66_13755 [Kocuria rhizophila]|nr:hypothetical protein QJS66_13755 [Kocuria rhizophila]
MSVRTTWRSAPGGTGCAARSWEAFDAIVKTLKELEDDETLLGPVRQTGWRLPHRTSGPRAC